MAIYYGQVSRTYHLSRCEAGESARAGEAGFTTIGEISALVGSGDCELEECRSLEAGSIVAISGLVILCILLDSFR